MNSDNNHLSLLIGKCKSASDVDGKLDAITKLQEEFQAGVEIHDTESLISVLKTCLRSSNQHLSTATLSAIVPLVPLLNTPRLSSSSTTVTTDCHNALRQVLNAFLPSGGIFERLGDNREKAREKAKEALISIGSVAFKTNIPQTSLLRGKEPKGPETPLQIFERYIKEQGLLSKSWRVREQSLMSLVQLRRAHSQFPLRPFLPALVDALEDSDGAVRDCAKQSIIEIFTDSSVSDAARTDLKKEMVKKNVRKTIVDSVLLRILSARDSTPSSRDPHDTTEEPTVSVFVPSRGQLPAVSRNASQSLPSDPDRPTSSAGEHASNENEVVPFYVASSRDLDNEFAQMLPAFEGKETEHNWLDRDKAVMKIRGMLKGEVHIRYSDFFVSGLKNGVLEGTLKSLASLRTTLATNTCSLYAELAATLGSLLDPFAELLLSHLLKMAGFTKKIIANQSQNVVDSIIERTSCHPRQTLPMLWNTLQDKNVQARSFAVVHIKTFVECHGLQCKQVIDSAGGIDILERCIKRGLGDANPGVKEKTRALFWSFEAIWKEKALAILGSLDAIARKQLQNASPIPLKDIGIPNSATLNAKKSSIAAAIAASRAKAKQIAAAPPTLRHQATSTSHTQHVQAVRAVSPVHNARGSFSPIVTPPPSSPSQNATSPSSPPRTSMRSGNKSPLAHERQRTMSSASSTSSPPPSPTAHHRRVSSSRVTPSIDHVVSQHSLSGHSSIPSSPLVLASSSSQPVNVKSMANSHLRPARGDVLDEPEESILMATSIPLPADSDMGDDDSVNLINFSAPWETSKPASRSAASSSPTPSASRLSNVPRSVVEDALRARAAQAESAAEQLLELVESDDDNHLSPIPLSLLPTNGVTPKLPPSRSLAPPMTPINQTSSIMRQAALFQDSPIFRTNSMSLFDIVQERKHQTGWWLKRMSIINQSVPLSRDFSQKVRELEECRQSLENESADLDILKKLTLLCHRNPTQHGISSLNRTPDELPMSPVSPSPKISDEEPALLVDIWDNGKRSEALFKSLCIFMKPEKDKILLEHGLFVLWELLPHLDGHDADILALLLRLRYAQDFNVDEGTLTIRDAHVELMNERNYSLYGLFTMENCLKVFLTQPVPSIASEDAKMRTYAFSLITMAKFIVKLPADILEEEIPKIKQTLIEAYLNAEAIVRQAATTAITAAQVILQDETHLFALLEPLPDDKKNLLTYFFEKSNARGLNNQGYRSSTSPGMERLSKEMDRLDQRLSTPPRLRSV